MEQTKTSSKKTSNFLPITNLSKEIALSGFLSREAIDLLLWVEQVSPIRIGMFSWSTPSLLPIDPAEV